MLLEICDRKPVWAPAVLLGTRWVWWAVPEYWAGFGGIAGGWPAPGPPCSCSVTFLSIFRAASRNGSDRNVCYYSGVFAFQVYFPRSVLGKNVGTCQPTTSLPSNSKWLGKHSPSVRVKLKHIAIVLLFFPSHIISKAEGISIFVCLFLTKCD